METFRFIHASDLHLGRTFSTIPEPPDGNIRGRLMEARHTAIARIANAARERQAAHVLLAGDTFDTPTPSRTVLRQALTAMGEAEDVTWWILPGNHDNLREAEPLWDAIRAEGPGNLRVLDTPSPIDLAEGVTLLPCPVEWRSAGRDPSDVLPGMTSSDGAIRIGLAHGGVTDFTGSGDAIPPDRDRTAALDYLALGDWHGRLAIGPRVHYPGAPEQDRFKHDRRGVCLAVTLEGAGAPPRIEEVETGTFLWSEIDVPLTARQDAAEALAQALPGRGRRDILMRVRATGWAGLPQRDALMHMVEQIGPDFAHLALETDDLSIAYDAADIDEIDRAGALRLAAEALLAEAEDPSHDAAARAVSGDALARLYSYMRAETE